MCVRAQEGRKRAIDVESASERKRVKTALETRVVKARSLCDAAITAAYKELIRASFDEYAEDKIDSAELDRRKKAAWEKKEKEKEEKRKRGDTPAGPPLGGSCLQSPCCPPESDRVMG